MRALFEYFLLKFPFTSKRLCKAVLCSITLYLDYGKSLLRQLIDSTLSSLPVAHPLGNSTRSKRCSSTLMRGSSRTTRKSISCAFHHKTDLTRAPRALLLFHNDRVNGNMCSDHANTEKKIQYCTMLVKYIASSRSLERRCDLQLFLIQNGAL